MHSEHREPTKEEVSVIEKIDLDLCGRALAGALWFHAYDQETLVLDKDGLEWLVWELLDELSLSGFMYQTVSTFAENSKIKPVECAECKKENGDEEDGDGINSPCPSCEQPLTAEAELPPLPPPGCSEKSDF